MKQCCTNRTVCNLELRRVLSFLRKSHGSNPVTGVALEIILKRNHWECSILIVLIWWEASNSQHPLKIAPATHNARRVCKYWLCCASKAVGRGLPGISFKNWWKNFKEVFFCFTFGRYRVIKSRIYAVERSSFHRVRQYLISWKVTRHQTRDWDEFSWQCGNANRKGSTCLKCAPRFVFDSLQPEI